jgi:uncharacterized protein YegL
MQLQGTERRFPIYLVLDVSSSMEGAPIAAVNGALAEFAAALKTDPQVLETAWVSVITFDSEARRAVPLTEAGAFHAPALEATGYTAMGAALRLLGDAIDADVRTRGSDTRGDWKPLVFLLTDGCPTDDWDAELAEFRARGRSVNLIAVGCGPAVDTDVLARITPNVMVSADLSTEKIRSFFRFVTQSIRTASRAYSSSPGDPGAPLLAKPEGFHLVLRD